MIIARTEALIAGQGIKEALNRAYAYEKAGADSILIHSKSKSPEEIFEFSKQWEGTVPLTVVPTSYPDVSIKELEKNNIKMVIYANQSLRASYFAINKLLEEIIDSDKISDVNQEMVSMEDIFQLQKMYDITNQQKKFC